MNQKRHVSNITKKNLLIIFATIAVIVGVVIYKVGFKSKSTYTVRNGYVEKVSDVTGIVLKEEMIIPLQNNTSAVPIVEQGKRVGKDEVIATYKSANYDKYLKEIEQVDSDIQTLIKDLPATYSVDVANIESEISELTRQAVKTTSYLKMQEYKSKIDELAYKKVNILGQLSPSGSKIRELIEKRQEMEEINKSSHDNIKATKSGVVTYKIDGLENAFDFNKALEFTKKDYEIMFEKYKNNNSNDFGIKIVNNYLAYLAIQIPKEENAEYIKEGRTYTIKTNEKESIEFLGKLVRILPTEKDNYVLFEITDGIENLVDHRTVNLEVIWDKTEGIAVLKNAIKRNEQNTYDYVTVVNGGEYLHVPIKIISENEGICIVDNFTSEEKEQLGIKDNKNKISLYDILVIS